MSITALYYFGEKVKMKLRLIQAENWQGKEGELINEFVFNRVASSI